MTRHATVVQAEHGRVYCSGEPSRALPPDYAAGGLGALLRRVAVHTGSREGVLLLDAPAADALGIPADEPPGGSGYDLVLEDAVALGWVPQSEGWRSWMTWKSPQQPVMRVGILPWMQRAQFGLGVWDDEARGKPLVGRATADALGIWYELTGSAYMMSPGVAALNVLRAMSRPTDPRYAPTWKSEVGPVDAYEDRQTMNDWRREDFAGTQRPWHCYDARRAGLAAMICAEVSPYRLRHAGIREFTPKLAGWWQIEVPAWNLDQMPHPAGPGAKDAGVTWVTNPTMGLLHQLADEGVIAAPLVVDSWTGPARRLFRPWGERMDTAYEMATRQEDTPWPTVARALKRGAAREAHGMIGAASGAIQRDDWFHTITATKRCNIWRRAWKIGRATGVWPIGIDDDNLIYTQPVDEFPMGEKLGEFRYETRSI